MRAFVLTDEQFAKLPRKAREALEDGEALPELETGAELHELVRASVPRKGNTPPAAFEEAAARTAALEQALEQARAEMRGLISEAYEQGVPQNTLARWSGYTPRWVGTILSDAA